MLPLKLLRLRSKTMSLKLLYDTFSNSPCNLFLDKWSSFNCGGINLDGKLPKILFFERSNISKKNMFPIHDGILLERWLSLTSNLDNELRLANEEGMLSWKPFKHTYRPQVGKICSNLHWNVAVEAIFRDIQKCQIHMRVNP